MTINNDPQTQYYDSKRSNHDDEVKNEKDKTKLELISHLQKDSLSEWEPFYPMLLKLNQSQPSNLADTQLEIVITFRQ